MRFHNNIGPQVRRRRYALGCVSVQARHKLQLAGFDISRSGVSKIEARLRFVDDKDLMFLVHSRGLSDFMEKLQTTRF